MFWPLCRDLLQETKWDECGHSLYYMLGGVVVRWWVEWLWAWKIPQNCEQKMCVESERVRKRKRVCVCVSVCVCSSVSWSLHVYCFLYARVQSYIFCTIQCSHLWILPHPNSLHTITFPCIFCYDLCISVTSLHTLFCVLLLWFPNCNLIPYLYTFGQSLHGPSECWRTWMYV